MKKYEFQNLRILFEGFLLSRPCWPSCAIAKHLHKQMHNYINMRTSIEPRPFLEKAALAQSLTSKSKTSLFILEFKWPVLRKSKRF